jgi:hypothetical protein
MSSMTAAEKRRFEKLLGMSSGYVLDFSNRTFDEFVVDTTGKQIFSSDYDSGSGSKANRLRAFWSKEPDDVVAQLLSVLLDYVRESVGESPEVAECARIVDRLRLIQPVAAAPGTAKQHQQGAQPSIQAPERHSSWHV